MKVSKEQGVKIAGSVAAILTVVALFGGVSYWLAKPPTEPAPGYDQSVQAARRDLAKAAQTVSLASVSPATPTLPMPVTFSPMDLLDTNDVVVTAKAIREAAGRVALAVISSNGIPAMKVAIATVNTSVPPRVVPMHIVRRADIYTSLRPMVVMDVSQDDVP